MFKKNWIGLVGILFIFLAFLTILKIGFDEGWIPEEAKIALGLGLGITGLFIGFSFFKKGKKTMAEISAGLGTGILYATFAYSSFSSNIQWSANTLLISMITLSAIVCFVGFKFDLRALSNISLVGGLLTPIVIRANSEQIFLLFCYVLILNVVSIYLSVLKNWTEIRLISFAATFIVYFIYYSFFKPESWEKPFFYISSFFLVYMTGIIFSSWITKDKFEGINLYLGILNGLNFTIWSIFIFRSFHTSYAIPLLIVGLVFVCASILIYFIAEGSKLPPLLYLIIGMALIAISGGDLGKLFTTKGMDFVVNALIWTFIVSILFYLSYYFQEEIGVLAGMGAYMLVFLYWFSNAWKVEWVEWFGVKYIPFVNPGALVWMSLASLGFLISISMDKLNQESQEKKLKIAGMPPGDYSLIFAIASHIVVGGLLTIQIENTWKAYDYKFLGVSSATSVSWILYSLILFLWGSHTKSKVFRIFGSIVLVITTLKVLFSDISGESTLYKAIFLLIIGMLILLIAFVNQKWEEKE